MRNCAALLGNGGLDHPHFNLGWFGIPPKSDSPPARAALQWGMNADADTIASLEHVLALQTLLLRAILDDMRPEDRRRVIERLAAAVADLPAPSEAADVAGAAWLARLVAPR